MTTTDRLNGIILDLTGIIKEQQVQADSNKQRQDELSAHESSINEKIKDVESREHRLNVERISLDEREEYISKTTKELTNWDERVKLEWAKITEAKEEIGRLQKAQGQIRDDISRLEKTKIDVERLNEREVILNRNMTLDAQRKALLNSEAEANQRERERLRQVAQSLNVASML